MAKQETQAGGTERRCKQNSKTTGGGGSQFTGMTGEARDMKPQGLGVRAAGGPAELQGI
jgi:hypothetical protein